MDDLKATLRHRIHYLLSVEAGEQRANASYPEIDALLDDLPLAEAAQGAAPLDYSLPPEVANAEVEWGAAPRAEGLLDDAENLIRSYVPEGSRLREKWLAEYARLSRPSDERVLESEEPR